MSIEHLSKSKLEFLIDEYIVGRNASRNKEILRYRLIDGMTYENIAEKVDMSDRQIKNIVYKYEQKLLKYI